MKDYDIGQKDTRSIVVSPSYSGSFSGRDGVHLNSRAKEHPSTLPNECPEHMPYCACEKKPRGLDVDCSRINAFKLKVVCDELRKVRWLARSGEGKETNPAKVSINFVWFRRSATSDTSTSATPTFPNWRTRSSWASRSSTSTSTTVT